MDRGTALQYEIDHFTPQDPPPDPRDLYGPDCDCGERGCPRCDEDFENDLYVEDFYEDFDDSWADA